MVNYHSYSGCYTQCSRYNVCRVPLTSRFFLLEDDRSGNSCLINLIRNEHHEKFNTSCRDRCLYPDCA
jgi:hypothetical protein